MTDTLIGSHSQRPLSDEVLAIDPAGVILSYAA
jgi:hypothetical protein